MQARMLPDLHRSRAQVAYETPQTCLVCDFSWEGTLRRTASPAMNRKIIITEQRFVRRYWQFKVSPLLRRVVP